MLSKFLTSLLFSSLLFPQQLNSQLCSWAFYSVPLVVDECNLANNFSIEATCESGVGILNFFNSTDGECSDSSLIYSVDADYYYCDGETGDDCDQIRLDEEWYYTDNCSGTLDAQFEWYFPMVNNLCFNFSLFGLSYNISENGVSITSYSGIDCSGIVYSSDTFSSGCNYNGNNTTPTSIYNEFEQVDNSGSGTTTVDSEDDITTTLASDANITYITTSGNNTNNGNGKDNDSANINTNIFSSCVISIAISSVFIILSNI